MTPRASPQSSMSRTPHVSRALEPRIGRGQDGMRLHKTNQAAALRGVPGPARSGATTGTSATTPHRERRRCAGKCRRCRQSDCRDSHCLILRPSWSDEKRLTQLTVPPRRRRRAPIYFFEKTARNPPRAGRLIFGSWRPLVTARHGRRPQSPYGVGRAPAASRTTPLHRDQCES
jgi:hypothetical protein